MNRVSPKVSVCIPVYNGSASVAESIESVLGQTFKDFRLIVCDNCSTDNTEEVVKRFHDPRLTYVRNEKNLGLVGNANRCLSLAEGEYVCIFHHDDVMLPENLELKVRLLDDHPEVGFVHSNIFMTDAEGQVLSQWVEDSRRDYIEDGMVVFHRYITRMDKGALIFIGAVLARRVCYEQLGGFRSDLPHTQDNEMWMRMSLFYNVACVGKPLVKWRQHSASASSAWGLDIAWLEEHFLATRIIFQEYQNQIPDLKSLQKEVDERFVKQALKRGINACGKDNFELGKRYLILASKFSKEIISMKYYWGLQLRLWMGPMGARLYRPVKKLFRERL